MTIFVSRAEWGSVYGTAGHPMAQVKDVVCHHTPKQEGGGVWEQAVAEVRAIERGHVEANEWGAIGYTWLVSGPFAFEGRGWGRTGAHAPGGNSTSIGIAFILDGRFRAPTPEEWRTAADVVREGVNRGAVAPRFDVWGHRDYVATACPSEMVYFNLTDLKAAYEAPTAPPPVQEDVMNAAQEKFFREKLDYIQGLTETAIHAANGAANKADAARVVAEAAHKQIDAICHANRQGTGGYAGGPYAEPLMKLLYELKDDLDILADAPPPQP